MIYTFMYFSSQVDQIHLKRGQNQHQIVMMLQCETVSKKIVRLIYESQIWQPYVISQDVEKNLLEPNPKASRKPATLNLRIYCFVL